jgi:hypothetical protein
MAYGAIIGGILGSSSSSSGGSSSGSSGGGLLSNVGVGQKVMGAAANLAGAFLGQVPDNPGGRILPIYDPAFDRALQATQFDALGQIGFGDVSAIPGPAQQLIGRILALPIEDRLKRRAIVSIQAMLRGKRPTRGDALGETLTQVGLEKKDVRKVVEKQAEFEEQMQRLSGLRGINTDTVMQRALSMNQAAQLLGAAGNFAVGGEPTDLQRQIRDSLSRNLDEQEEQMMLRAQYGGYNPSAGLESITDQRLELDLRAIEKSLAVASGLSGSLGMGLSAARGAGQDSSTANLNALGIAAQQAQAANSIRNANAQFNADSLANGVAGAIAAIGKSSYNGLNRGGSTVSTGSTPASYDWGPGSTNQQYATQSANYGGWSPSVDFSSFGQ